MSSSPLPPEIAAALDNYSRVLYADPFPSSDAEITDARAALESLLASLCADRDELRGVVEWTATVLESGSNGVPADSEAASYLHGTIDKALRSLSVARAAAGPPR